MRARIVRFVVSFVIVGAAVVVTTGALAQPMAPPPPPGAPGGPPPPPGLGGPPTAPPPTAPPPPAFRWVDPAVRGDGVATTYQGALAFQAPAGVTLFTTRPPHGFLYDAAAHTRQYAAYDAAARQPGAIRHGGVGVFLKQGGAWLFVPGSIWSPGQAMRTPDAPVPMRVPITGPQGALPPPCAPPAPCGPPQPLLPNTWVPFQSGFGFVVSGATTTSITPPVAPGPSNPALYQQLQSLPNVYKAGTAGLFFPWTSPGYLMFVPGPTWTPGAPVAIPAAAQVFLKPPPAPPPPPPGAPPPPPPPGAPPPPPPGAPPPPPGAPPPPPGGPPPPPGGPHPPPPPPPPPGGPPPPPPHP